MPKTPIQNEVAKSNPFITKGINKTLLTPCRQVGLSRKKKTPNSSSSNVSENSLNLSVSSNTCLDTTPVTSQTLDEETSVTISRKNVDKDKRKTRVSKRLIEDNNEPSGHDVKHRKIDKIEEINEEPKPIPHADTSFKTCEGDAEEADAHKENDSIISNKTTKSRTASRKRVTKRLVSDDDEDTLEAVRTRNINKKYDGADFDESSKALQDLSTPENEKSPVKKKKETAKKCRRSPRKCNKKVDTDYVYEDNSENVVAVVNKTNKGIVTDLSDKESTSNSASLNKMFEKNKNNEPLVGEVVEQESNDPKAKIRDNEILHKSRKRNSKLKRCLSMKKSSEDQTSSKFILRECSVNLSPLEHTEDDLRTISEISTNEIENLKKQIEEKKKNVQELKQAEIYKRKHDITELRDLTSRWKMGCIQALNDLLPKLQTGGGDLDMEMLLKKLNIPEDKIRLSDNGDLI